MKTHLRCLIVALGVVGCALSSLGANLTWTGSLSQDFYNATNWSPQGVPAAGDTLNITNGNVTISPAFTSTGQLNWTGGSISGGLIISGAGTLALSGGNTKFLSASITNSGTVTLAGTGQLQFGNANLKIVNQPGALFDLQGDATITWGGNVGLLITNAGTFSKSAGTNTSQIIGIPVQNTGALFVSTGTLDLQAGGTLGGSWTAYTGAALTFSGGNFTLLPNAVATNAGPVGVASGSPTFTGTLGTVLNWTGGSIGGDWSISPSGYLAMSGPSTKFLGGSITNAGTMTLTGATQLQFANPNLRIINQTGALFYIQGDNSHGDGSITWGGNSGALITNAGLFIKAFETNTSPIIGITFQNTGTLFAVNGTLDLQAGGTLGGTLAASNGAALTFSSGNFTLLSNAVSMGPGFVGVTGSGSGPTFTGTLGTTLDWSGGSIAGGWNISPSGTLALSSGNTKFLSASITNSGAITVAGAGQLQFGNANLQIVNQSNALFDLQSDATITWGGNSGLLITNAGTFRKSAGTNTSQIINIPVQNTGTLSALTGILNISSAFTNSGGTLAARLNSLSDWGRFAFSGNLVLNGLLQVTIANGFAPAQSNQFQLITGSTLTGTFASLNVPQGTAVSYSNNSVYLLVNSAIPAQLFNPVNVGGNPAFSLGTANGQSYTVQRNDSLTTTNWVFYTNFVGNGSIMQVVVPTSGVPLRFFRVREP